ncbi:hypothetical protein [Pandoraea faecigallinarum]|uniref:hypothetical protein n=1 Tax=Pandoraea faecigallinarum TaxID=656179 RepID=UPI000B141FEA|nr:hypothetical protein [Pandoraea faecigallinarum]
MPLTPTTLDGLDGPPDIGSSAARHLEPLERVAKIWHALPRRRTRRSAARAALARHPVARA